MFAVQYSTLLLCLNVACIVAFPADTPESLHLIRHRRGSYPPGRAMMLSGYFGGPHGYHYNRPSYQGRSYEPDGAMTAFAAGNTVSAGSYYGNEQQPSANVPGCGHCDGENPTQPAAYPTNDGPQPPEAPESAQPVTDVPTGGEVPHANDGTAQAAPEVKPATTANGVKRTRAPKAPKRPIQEEDEEEYDDDKTPAFSPGRGKGPGSSFNSYFPMYFGFPGMFGGREEETGQTASNPGVATAIANSFSTGKGAIASSHATAYGGPNLRPHGYSRGGSRPRPDNGA